ncbi:Mediator of RNA polymerase II transcription subunit 22, partial [Lemmus lemmus]
GISDLKRLGHSALCRRKWGGAWAEREERRKRVRRGLQDQARLCVLASGLIGLWRRSPGSAMSQQRALPQSKETLLQSYNKRLKDDIKSIMDNFTEIIKTAKIEDETQVSRATQGEQDNYEMHVRAANIVRAGESLMKLVSDLKQFLILNDFPSVNEAIDQRNQQLRALQEECDRKLITLRDEVSIDLYELEEEYYSSRYK